MTPTLQLSRDWNYWFDLLFCLSTHLLHCTLGSQHQPQTETQCHRLHEKRSSQSPLLTTLDNLHSVSSSCSRQWLQHDLWRLSEETLLSSGSLLKCSIIDKDRMQRVFVCREQLILTLYFDWTKQILLILMRTTMALLTFILNIYGPNHLLTHQLERFCN